MPKPKRDYTVVVVVRSFAILEAMARSGREMGVLEVSKTVKMHVSTVYRLLNTLMQREFVDQNPETEKYRLGIRLFELGLVRVRQLDFRNVALPYLRALQDEFQETVFLGTLRGNEALIIDSFSQPRGIVFGSQVGAGEPLYCTGIGKALLANLPPDRRERIVKALELRRFTSSTLTSRSELRNELDLIRKRGYSIDNEEIVEGVKCVAAPILAADGYAVASFSIAGPADRVRGRFKSIAARVGDFSRQINAELARLEVTSPPVREG
jgi:DNA-binding IclR family transcriptional regulator